MADMYSKLLGLSDATPSPTPAKKELPERQAKLREKKTRVLANQQTSKPAQKQSRRKESHSIGQTSSALQSPPQKSENVLDTSLLSTKEKTKYGTYLTDESIQKISIRAIQTNKHDHQIVQEAVNQYFERLEK